MLLSGNTLLPLAFLLALVGLVMAETTTGQTQPRSNGSIMRSRQATRSQVVRRGTRVKVARQASPVPGSCAALSDPYTSNGKVFDVACSGAFVGGLVSRAPAADFKTCVDRCAVTSG